MASRTVSERAQTSTGSTFSAHLGKPISFAITALLLFGLFSWTFIASPDRVAPTKDPAYYTWRTEALITEPPETLLEVEGALGMFEGGYRVTAPILGGFLRQVADVPTLRTTVYLMVLLPVAIALLLAGYAYRKRKDPLLWHAVALGSGSLLLTPPFVGYLDNLLCLFFLAASLFFIEGARDRVPHRIAFGSFLVLAGLTHPTTLAFFGVVVGLFGAVRLIGNGFNIRSALRDEGPLLLTAAGSAAIVLGIWTVGLWGESASLTESALPPPYDSDFFVDRMLQWVGDMNPVFNVPLLVAGLVGLLAVGRKALDDELSKITILWLVPLAGLFGFLGGLTYPYYRFFNTTLSWVLLIGMGLYFLLVLLRDRGAAMGRTWLFGLGLLAAVAVISSNFVHGYESSNWNEPTRGWISDQTRQDLDALRARLSSTDEDRPVVFVIDDEPARDFQIWGFTKLSGNTSRYGLPPGQIDRGYLYLGDIENLLRLEPTIRGEETYDRVSSAVLEEALAAIEETGMPPVIVVAEAFNPRGANPGFAEAVVTNERPPDSAEPAGPLEGAELLAVSGGAVVPFGAETEAGASSRIGADPEDKSSREGALHLLLVALGLVALLAPGYLFFRWVLPDAGVAEALGLVPALAASVLSVVGVIALALVKQPLSGIYAWTLVGLSIGIGAVLARRRDPAGE